MKNKLFILAICILFVSNGWSENRRSQIDSLRKILSTCYQDTNRINIMNKLSEDYVAMDIYDSAIYFAFNARELSQQLQFSAGEAASDRMIGIGYTCQGFYSKSLGYLFQALKISESIKDNYLIGKTCNSIGVNYSFQRDYKNALNYLYKSLSFYYNPLIYEDIARVYHLQNDYMLAISFYRKALLSKIPEIEKSYIYNDLGDIYEQQNNIDSALTFYFKSLKINTELQDEVGISDAAGSIGDLIYLKQKKYNDAIFYEETSLRAAKKINYKYGIKETSKSLSEIYEVLGDKNRSLKYYKDYVTEKDSLFNEENTKKTVQSQMQYDFDKKESLAKLEQEKKDAIAKQEKQKQMIIIYSIAGGLLLVIIFSGFIFRSLRITRKQKNIIELQKNEVLRQKEIADEQRKLVEEKNRETSQNITYAKRIQDATMPSMSRVLELLPNSFIFNRGRDIVSGDFYFVEKVSDDKIIFSVADSTSHGVSGSMMSILNSNLLGEAVRSGIHTPSKILDYVNMALARAFHQTDGNKEVKDGMDISICAFNTKTMMLEFSGAYNGLMIVRNKQLIELDADKLQLGQSDRNYTNHEFLIQSGDMIYLSSDGFADQFGGDKNKKYKYKNFTSLLCNVSDLSCNEQYSSISNEFDSWKGDNEQTDDTLVMGIRF